MDCHFQDLPDFQSSEARLMTASAVHKLSECSDFMRSSKSEVLSRALTISKCS